MRLNKPLLFVGCCLGSFLGLSQQMDRVSFDIAFSSNPSFKPSLGNSFSGNLKNGGVSLEVYSEYDGSAIKPSGFISVPKETTSVFSLAPNPSSEYIQIKFDPSIGKDAKVRITDVNGAEVVPAYSVTNGDQIDVSSFASGVYFIQLSTEKKAFETSRIVKTSNQ